MDINIVNRAVQEEQDRLFLELATKTLIRVKDKITHYERQLQLAKEDEKKASELIESNDIEGLINFKISRSNPFYNQTTVDSNR